jgi:hypothetical protein
MEFNDEKDLLKKINESNYDNGMVKQTRRTTVINRKKKIREKSR